MARFTHPAMSDGSGISQVLPYHGSFYSLTDQQAQVSNVTQAVMFEEVSLSFGVTVEQDDDNYYTKITFENPGVYNLAFSAQLHHRGGGGSGQDIYMWFRKNGQDIVDSNTRLTVTTNSPYIVASWNFFVSVEAGDFVQLVGYPTNTSIVLEHINATSTQPAIPSIILTVNQIS